MENLMNELDQNPPRYDWRKLSLELIVIFLGITAGLLVNDWQLARQDARLEQQYLAGFLQDVSRDIADLEQQNQTDTEWLARVKPGLLAIRNSTLTLDNANAIVKDMVAISRAELSAGTYEAVINSGNLGIIRDYALQKQIVDYQAQLAAIRFVDGYFYEFFGDFVMPFIITNFSVISGNLENPAVITSNRFANIVAGYYAMVQQRQAIYTEALTAAHALQDTLQTHQMISELN